MKRLGTGALMALLLLSTATVADDVDPTARAKAAGEAAKLGSGSSVFSVPTVENTVTPYDGTDIPETGINNSNIDARIQETLGGDTDASKAFTDMNDSISLRKKYDLDESYIGIQVGDQSSKNAEAIAGKYFSSESDNNSACDFSNFEILPQFERYCDVVKNLTTKNCSIMREVTVERTDTWHCDITRDVVTTVCETSTNGKCPTSALPVANESLQCSEVGNSCLEREVLTTREPASGALYSRVFPNEQGDGGYKVYEWLRTGNGHEEEYRVSIVWNRVTIFSGRSTAKAIAVGDCTYYPGEGGLGYDGSSGVYRVCKSPGRCLKEEYQHDCISNNECSALEASPSCNVASQECLNYGGYGCRQTRNTYVCENDATTFDGAQLSESKINSITDKLVNQCNPDPTTQGCAITENVCVSGPDVRVINGFPVSRDCWEYDQTYQCIDNSSTPYTDCSPFRSDPSCKEISRTCLSFVESDDATGEVGEECQHWEYGYQCGGNIEFPENCSAANVCIGGLCEGYIDEPNTDFANAAAWLTVLDEAAKDSQKSLDGGSVTLFSGTSANCKVGVLGTINCCKDSGWANDIIGDCSESELALMDRIQAKAAVYVGTYCSKSVLGVCLQKKRSYCTFNSQLGMVFQKEIRRLSGKGWGKAKNPNCAGLPLEEIDTIDWDQIDLSEAFIDMMNESTVPTSSMVTDYLRDRLELTAGSISEED